ncbi:hypothetical protein MCP1_330031 [Candidatus Terasakiella magnetica]|nr:hypothetical protein MCP1_330031 [Candidatus Terasakiella magnetica]
MTIKKMWISRTALIQINAPPGKGCYTLTFVMFNRIGGGLDGH